MVNIIIHLVLAVITVSLIAIKLLFMVRENNLVHYGGKKLGVPTSKTNKLKRESKQKAIIYSEIIVIGTMLIILGYNNFQMIQSFQLRLTLTTLGVLILAGAGVYLMYEYNELNEASAFIKKEVQKIRYKSSMVQI